jgi:hypothetical protein
VRDELNVKLRDLGGNLRRQDPTPRPIPVFFNQPCILRRPADRTAPKHAPILAAFDADNAVIWANETLLENLKRTQLNQQELSDDDVQTLAHEFARLLEYRGIFQDNYLHEDRVRAIRKRRGQQVMRSTIESFANRKLAEERRAEETAQRVRMEILSTFDKAQRGPGFSENDIASKANEQAADLVNKFRKDYLSTARIDFSRLHSAGGEVSRSIDSVDKGADNFRKKVLLVRDIRCLFPLTQSATLKDLVDEMIYLRVKIIVAIASTGIDALKID